MSFKKATKKQSRARIALIGPAGSGKTYTALRLAHSLADGGTVAVFDTERGSASKYAGDANPDGGVFEFDCMDDMKNYDANLYIKAIRDASAAGYAVLVIDSLSHAWAGTGGILEFKDQVAAANKNDSFGAWKKATPLYNKLIDAILNAPLHVIATMRSKTEYVIEKNDHGKSVPRKVGMQPIQRDGLEYEFDVIIDTDGGTSTISKSRCSALKGSYHEAGEDIGSMLKTWLTDGAVPPAPVDDPSWEADSAEFIESLKSMDTNYETVARVCESINKPRPSQMTSEQRNALIEWLRGKGASKLQEQAC